MIGYVLDALVLFSFQPPHRTLIYFCSFLIISAPPPPQPQRSSHRTHFALYSNHIQHLWFQFSVSLIWGTLQRMKIEEQEGKMCGRTSEAESTKKSRGCLQTPEAVWGFRKIPSHCSRVHRLGWWVRGMGRRKKEGCTYSLKIRSWEVSPIPSQIPSNSLRVSIWQVTYSCLLRHCHAPSPLSSHAIRGGMTSPCVVCYKSQKNCSSVIKPPPVD